MTSSTAERASVAFAFNEKSFWLYFISLGVIASFGVLAKDMLVVGMAIGATLGAITGRASMTGEDYQ